MQEPNNKIAVVLQGGLVQAVVSNDETLLNRKVIIIDYDPAEVGDPDELTPVDQMNGELIDAYITIEEINRPNINIDEIDTGENCYTVIGFWTDTGQKFMDHVTAKSGDEAERLTMMQYTSTLTITGVIEGHHHAAETNLHVATGHHE